MLTERFDEAFRYAHRLHRDQTRKGTSIPYISHLMPVHNELLPASINQRIMISRRWGGSS